MSSLARFALIISAAALFAGCAGTQLPIAGPSASRLGVTLGREHWRAPMRGGVANWDLLYASKGTTVDVYRYWQHTLVESLAGFKFATGECVDSSGNVYVTDSKGNDVVEYAHGGTKPIRTFHAKKPLRCAVDQHNGDLAIANWRMGVSVYRPGKIKPIIYTGLYRYAALGYDNNDNLLVTTGCTIPDSSCPPAGFAYLPRRGVKLNPIDLTFPSAYFLAPTDILWDGKYWVIVQAPTLFRFSITGSKATYVSQTTLADFPDCGLPLGGKAIYNNDPKKQGIEVVGLGYKNCNTGAYALYFWNYPSGRDPIGSINTLAWDAAISCARSGCER